MVNLSACPFLDIRDTATPVWLLRISLRLQGRTFGAPGLTAQAVNSEDGPRAIQGKERPERPAASGRRCPLDLAVPRPQLAALPSAASPSGPCRPRTRRGA